MNKLEVLKRYFGHDGFRPGQEELIDSVLGGRDVLGIMPTGAGKSVCYQVPAMLMDGVTVVVSPLISLMKDQVGALRENGIPCAYVNSSLDYRELKETYERAAAGDYKIIYAAPERLCTADFLRLSETVKMSMVTVDEAHCVSQWGQDFRPGYLKITEYIKSLSYRPPIGAFTATATEEVRRDIIKLLELKEPKVAVTGFDRKNLYFEVKRPKAKDKLNQLVYFLGGRGRGKSGIVYAISRKTVESVCDELCERGFAATRYHAGLSPEERRRNQDDFLYDRKTVMVATNAFGMGIDKSNVSFVVHYNMPKNIESYYQEAGRAGRDGSPSDCLLLYAPGDVRTNKFLIDNTDENEELSDEEREFIRERDYERLRQMTFYATTDDCLRGFILKYFGETAGSECGNCSNCLEGFETRDVTEPARMILSCIMRMMRRGTSYGRTTVADVLAGSQNEKITDRGLDTLTTYGIMKDHKKKDILRIIDFMLEKGYLSVKGDKYGVLVPCRKAGPLLRGEETLTMRMPKPKPKEEPRRKKPLAAEIDEGLMGELKALRLELAKAQSVPAYVIFTDASLREMCAAMPETLAEFSDIPGVGAAKLDRYGAVFVDLISQYKNRKKSRM